MTYRAVIIREANPREQNGFKRLRSAVRWIKRNRGVIQNGQKVLRHSYVVDALGNICWEQKTCIEVGK